jgi:tRNA A64-2'-O-ribosylphosphate transferase
MSSKVLGESDLIFSSASSALREALGELKRSDQSVKNRLQSIYSDAAFVQSVAEAYNLPLVANERCGSWYIPHEAESAPAGFVHGKQGSVYFKSTDGHFGQWSFSLRRLNLQILELIGQHGG